jgi:DNA-binding GntR family transcriptional regulator
MQQKMLSFESEQSLGPTGDGLFLELRHRILTAQYAPGQLIDANRLASSAAVPRSLVFSVFQALIDHGYLAPLEDERSRVIHWTNSQLEDLIEACHDLIGLAIDKCMSRIDADGLSHLREALDFSFVDPVGPDQVETFQIRWWIFFHTIISTIEVRNFRKMMLTGMPPALRRRVITALNANGLRSMLADMTALIGAFEERDKARGRELLDHQFAAFTPYVVETNVGFNGVSSDEEVDYSPGDDLMHPVFRQDHSDLPPFSRGIREPLSWAEFKALPAIL